MRDMHIAARPGSWYGSVVPMSLFSGLVSSSNYEIFYSFFNLALLDLHVVCQDFANAPKLTVLSAIIGITLLDCETRHKAHQNIINHYSNL
jgi:hypothetical protein